MLAKLAKRIDVIIGAVCLLLRTMSCKGPEQATREVIANDILFFTSTKTTYEIPQTERQIDKPQLCLDELNCNLREKHFYPSTLFLLRSATSTDDNEATDV